MKYSKAEKKFINTLLHAWPYCQALHFAENHNALPEQDVAGANWPQQIRLSDLLALHSSMEKALQNIYLHGVVGVLVVKDKRLLDLLVVSFQLVNLWFVIHDALLILPQVVELVLQGPVHLY